MNDCPHETVEPVEVRSHITGETETVAQVCIRCLAALPAEWGCGDCSWVDARRLCDPGPRLMLGERCIRHAAA